MEEGEVIGRGAFGVVHLGINLALALVVGAPNGALATAPLMTAMAYNPVYDLASLAILCGVHYGVMVRLARR